MFAVLIEAEPRKGQSDAHLAAANMLCPELGQAPGFIDHIGYRSLTRDGWILSLCGWRDETSVLGWRARMRGDEAWERGLSNSLAGYRLRIGEVTSDTRVPEVRKVAKRRLGGSETGEGTYVTLIDAKQAREWVASNNPQEIALYLGFDLYSYGDCISWDVFENISRPGEIILVVTWKDAESANDHAATQMVPEDARVRVLRIICDDRLPDRRGARRDHPDAAGHEANPA